MNGPYPPSGVGPGDFVFAAVALGRRHVNWSLAMIESLRTNGGFLGSIYLATDHPRSYSGMDDVVVVPVQGGGRAAAKRYKTTLFEWVPADRVVYIDADVVVGGTLDDWWCHLAELRRDKSLLVFADPGHSDDAGTA